MIQPRLKSNIWKYTIFLIANKRIFVAILGAYYLSMSGVTAKSIGFILLVGSLAGFIFEIPSGYISDKIGHKQALIISRLAMLTSTLFFLFANNLTFLIIGSVFLSIGNSFLTGTGSAFMHETLRGLNKENAYAQIMGKIRSIGFAVPIIFMISVPFLVSINFKAPFIAGLIFDLIGLFTSLSLIVPQTTAEEIKEIRLKNFKQVIKEGYNFGFLRFALLSGTLGGLAFSVGRFRDVYQSFLEIPVIYYGIFLGISRLIVVILLRLSGKIKKSTNIYSFFGLRILLFLIIYMLLGIFTEGWMVVIIFILLNSISLGFGTVNSSYLLEIIKLSKFKATLLSATSQIRLIVEAIMGLTIGVVIDLISYQTAFTIVSIILLFTTVPIYIFILNNKKVLP